MSHFRFLVLGVGDAFSTRWYSSCLALETEGWWLLVDCPHPIRKILREASEAAGLPPLDLDQVRAAAVTHLHADHCSGLEGMGFYAHYHLQQRVTLLTHRRVADDVWDHHLKAGMGDHHEDDLAPEENHLSTFFDLHLLSESHPVEYGPFSIECRTTQHPIPTTAFRITAAGRTLGFSADTAFDPTLIEWLSKADLIVHETNLGIHTPYEKLAALPEALRSKMRLIHYPDDFDVAASVIRPLRQGEIHEV